MSGFTAKPGKEKRPTASIQKASIPNTGEFSFTNPHHVEIDLSGYANAGNKGAYVNKLDYVVLSALEIDTKFNVNVITGWETSEADSMCNTKT